MTLLLYVLSILTRLLERVTLIFMQNEKIRKFLLREVSLLIVNIGDVESLYLRIYMIVTLRGKIACERPIANVPVVSAG